MKLILEIQCWCWLIKSNRIGSGTFSYDGQSEDFSNRKPGYYMLLNLVKFLVEKISGNFGKKVRTNKRQCDIIAWKGNSNVAMTWVTKRSEDK